MGPVAAHRPGGRQLCLPVPYYLHFYGPFGTGPEGLTVPLPGTSLWFLVATVLLVTLRRDWVPAMASFLPVEALFCLVHNVSVAAERDFAVGGAVLVIASIVHRAFEP